MTALSVAGNIVQFIDFGAKVISTAKELSQSAHGATRQPIDLEILTRDLCRVVKDLKAEPFESSISATTGTSDTLLGLRNGCIQLSEDMLQRLQKKKATEGSGRLKILIQSVKCVWSQQDLDEMAAQLGTYRRQLEFHLLVEFRENHNLGPLTRKIDSLSRDAQTLLLSIQENWSVFDSAQHFHHREMHQKVTEEHAHTRFIMLQAVQQITSGIEMEKWQGTRKEETYHEEIADLILRSLLFPSSTARYEQIAESHKATFEWIVTDPEVENQPWSSFTKWLKSGDGVYWTNGKAGCGKSTLMKFLFNDSRTRELLSCWYGSRQLALAHFFFWNSGTREQKSQLGLLRSILHTILKSHKELIPSILNRRWEATYHQMPFLEEWTYEELSEAIKLLGRQ